jgi:acetoin utilization deacetylase AcuC-like enzyme
VKCFYNEGYYLPLPPEHPFPMDKFPRAHALLVEEAPELDVQTVEPAGFGDLLRVHRMAYLKTVGTRALPDYDRNRLGLPAHERLLERCRMETQGTVAAGFAALEDGLAANLAGGTHHAFAERGLGFCVLNDVAVAARAILAEAPETHIMVIDTDAHQGNGTHFLLRGEPTVITYSIHVGANYPAQKEPGDVDVPLERYVAGADFLQALERTLPPAFERAEPDLVFWIAGADNHHDDRFGQMRLDDADMAARDRFVLELVRGWEVPTAVLYGGGYNRDRAHTARLHANTVLAAADVFRAGRAAV